MGHLPLTLREEHLLDSRASLQRERWIIEQLIIGHPMGPIPFPWWRYGMHTMSTGWGRGQEAFPLAGRSPFHPCSHSPFLKYLQNLSGEEEAGLTPSPAVRRREEAGRAPAPAGSATAGAGGAEEAAESTPAGSEAAWVAGAFLNPLPFATTGVNVSSSSSLEKGLGRVEGAG